MRIVLNLEIADGVFDACVADPDEIAEVIERAVRKSICRKLELYAEVIAVKRDDDDENGNKVNNKPNNTKI